MADTEVSKESDENNHLRNEPLETDISLDFPQTLVTEKIIFVIDILLLVNDDENMIQMSSVYLSIQNFINLKKKTCVKPPEFECILYHNNAIFHSYINNTHDLQRAFKGIENAEVDLENQPLVVDKIFDEIAKSVELPDPSCSENLPPEWVYHIVWLFSRNIHLPVMENTNSFDYLMMTPYVALDILYVYDKSDESNQCEKISEALLGLNENNKGYFLQMSATACDKFPMLLVQFIGHPLIRPPQSKAMYNILKLGPQNDTVNSNKNEE